MLLVTQNIVGWPFKYVGTGGPATMATPCTAVTLSGRLYKCLNTVTVCCYTLIQVFALYCPFQVKTAKIMQADLTNPLLA